MRLLVGALILAAVGLFGGCEKLGLSGSQHVFNATDITGVGFASALSLPDVDGRPHTIADWRGKVLVVFFGYTNCPDVCPVTMAELAAAKKSLGSDGDRVQGIFITLDPERDTPDVLKRYVGNFDPGFIALRGTPAQTTAAAKEFKVFFEKVPGKVPGSYTLDHTAGSYIFDPSGKVRLFLPYGSGPDALAADLRTLLKAG